MHSNVGQVLAERAARTPDKAAILTDGETVSYEDLHQRAQAVATTLRTAGLVRGDRVAIFLENGVDLAGAWFGVLYAGCTTVPIASYATAHELGFRLKHASCKAILTSGDRTGVAHEAKMLAQSRALLLDATEPTKRGENAPICANEAGDVSMILYTSGTLGAAKGVCITHGSLLTHTQSLVAHTLGLRDTDRVLGTLPLTHSYGIRMTLLAPFAAGASTVFVRRFDASDTLRACEEHAVTWLPGVPTMFVAWAQDESSYQPSSLKWCLCAGAPLTETARVAAERRLGTTVRQGYGLTEATFTAINAPPDPLVPGSVGRPVHGVRVRISDDGEVLVRGPNVMDGYLNDMTATQHVMRDGWLHTGDIGTLDDAGRLRIIDRTKDIVLRGGHTIYPSELEQVLAAHDSVQEVAVVGIPDETYGEEVVAVLVARPGTQADELDAWARTHLSGYKVPRQYAFAEELPVGGSGKILKRSLREALCQGELTTQSPQSRQ